MKVKLSDCWTEHTMWHKLIFISNVNYACIPHLLFRAWNNTFFSGVNFLYRKKICILTFYFTNNGEDNERILCCCIFMWMEFFFFYIKRAASMHSFTGCFMYIRCVFITKHVRLGYSMLTNNYKTKRKRILHNYTITYSNKQAIDCRRSIK